MNQTDKNIQIAEMEWMTVAGRFFLNITNLRTFAGTTAYAFDGGASDLRENYQKAAKEVANDPLVKQTIPNSIFGHSPQLLKAFSDALAQRSIRLAQQTADSASLVFAHSMLDGVLSECCTISCLANAEDWLPFVRDRKVALTELRTRTTRR